VINFVWTVGINHRRMDTSRCWSHWKKSTWSTINVVAVASLYRKS